VRGNGMRSGLSEREQRFLDVVRDCAERNYTPSNAELLERTGASSVSALEVIKSALLRRGLLRDSSTEPLGVEIAPFDELPPPERKEIAPERLVLWERALRFIWEYKQKHRSSPNYKEIGHAVGRSNESVSRLMNRLLEDGYIHRARNVPRSIELTSKAFQLLGLPPPGSLPEPTAYVPLLGRIAAGLPSEARQSDEGGLLLPSEVIGQKATDELFLLRVDGPSMTEAGILDGDVVLVHRVTTVSNGDIVAVMLDAPIGGESVGTTVKRYRLEGDSAWLVPAHPSFEPIRANHAEIQGKVIALLRWPMSSP
jgi:repressor LexA